MERIIKAIEEKLKAQETDIFLLKHENDELRKKLAERDCVIAELQSSNTGLERRF